MPASNEIVSNRPLSGSELRNIILKDVGNMLDRDGMFSPHIGYGRVAYDVIIKLHIDNPAYPEHQNRTTSRTPATNETDEGKKAIAPPPLQDPSSEAVVAAMQRTREIDSPNLARLEHELPVTITRRDGQTGQMIEEPVVYDNKEVVPTPVKDVDISKKTAAEWEL